MQTIAVLNSKGGSGKTTVSINLASYYAQTGRKTVIIDYDSQGSSTHWINSRSENQAIVDSIPAYNLPAGLTQSFQMKVKEGTEKVIIDTPGAISLIQLEKIVKRTDFIIVPVQPSSIDIHAVTDFIEQLIHLRPIQWGKAKVAVVANRVKDNIEIFDDLAQFLEQRNIPFLTKIHDSENYLHATNEAMGLFEIEPHMKVAQDKSDWHPIINWLEQKDVFSVFTTVSHISETANNVSTEKQNQLEQVCN